MIITLVGAESTGKSDLAHALALHYIGQGLDAIAVGEYLREWCALQGRTPSATEQTHIATTQHLRIHSAAAQHRIVIADTTALMTAVYSDWVFADRSLYAQAIAQQCSFDVTLLTGLDMPWQADGIQREGAHVRGPVDALLRSALNEAQIGYRVVYGQGPMRLKNAIDCIATHVHNTGTTAINASQKWVWTCDKCSDPDCEHRLFSQLTAPSSAPADGPAVG
ncbi:MAG: ATP-binding protein [Burkholderiaceae bacterium]